MMSTVRGSSCSRRLLSTFSRSDTAWSNWASAKLARSTETEGVNRFSACACIGFS